MLPPPIPFSHRQALARRALGSAAYLALERLHRRVHDHVGLEGLLLHEGLEADVALVGPDAGVDQHVALHVGLQGELPATHLTFELLHTLLGVETALRVGALTGAISGKFIFTKYFFCRCICVSAKVHMTIRGQLSGLGLSLHHVSSEQQTRVIRLVG